MTVDPRLVDAARRVGDTVIAQRLAHHLTAADDPCQDRGVDWPCDVAQAILDDHPTGADPAGPVDVFDEARRERHRAHAKHGDTSMESTPAHDPTGRRMRVLLEEVGEVCQELNDAEHADRLPDMAALRAELVQVCAMAGAWAAACDDSGLIDPPSRLSALHHAERTVDALAQALDAIPPDLTPEHVDTSTVARALDYHLEHVRRFVGLLIATEARRP